MKRRFLCSSLYAITAVSSPIVWDRDSQFKYTLFSLWESSNDFCQCFKELLWVRKEKNIEANLLQVKSSVCPIVILNYFKSVQMNWAKRETMWGDCEGVHHSTCEDLQSIMSHIKTHLSFVHHLWNAWIAKRHYLASYLLSKQELRVRCSQRSDGTTKELNLEKTKLI